MAGALDILGAVNDSDDLTHDPPSLRAIALRRIPDAQRADALRDALVRLAPDADARLVREALGVVLAADPSYWLDDRALLHWLRRVEAEQPALSLLAWLAGMLVEWGLLDGDGRNIRDVAPLGGDAYLDALRWLWSRPTTPATVKAQRWLVARARREPEVLTAVATETLGALCRALAAAPSRAPTPEGRWPEASADELIRLAFDVRDAACAAGEAPPAMRAPLARAWAAIAEVDVERAGNFAERLRGAIPECVDALLASGPPPTPELLRKLLSVWDTVTLEGSPAMVGAIAAAHSSELARLYLFARERGEGVGDLLLGVRGDASLLDALGDALDDDDWRDGYALFDAVPYEHAARVVRERAAQQAPDPGSLLEELAERVANRG